MTKDTNIILRTGTVEKHSFERAAELAGETLSNWIRSRLRSACSKELKNHNETPEFTRVKK